MSADSGTNNMETEVKRKPGRPTNEERARLMALGYYNKKKKKRRGKRQESFSPHSVPLDVAINELRSTRTKTQSGFTVNEILDIMKTGNQSNVDSLTYNGLILHFRGAVAMPSLPKPVSQTLGRQTPEQSSSLRDMNEREVKQQVERANLILHDPMAFEQDMIDSMSGSHERENG